jgi:hypothetical protein
MLDADEGYQIPSMAVARMNSSLVLASCRREENPATLVRFGKPCMLVFHHALLQRRSGVQVRLDRMCARPSSARS